MPTDPPADPADTAPSPLPREEGGGADDPGWRAATHPLGRGSVRAENVVLREGGAALSLSAGAYDGAEILTAARHGTGAYQARMRTPHAPGSVSAFFLYEGVEGGNDEIDIELFNDGTRRVMFTTWVAGRETNNVIQALPFDPAAAFHDYRVEWSAQTVRFRVDGVVMQEFRSGIPRSAMFVMANTWWPAWLTGPLLAAPRTLAIDRIQLGG